MNHGSISNYINLTLPSLHLQKKPPCLCRLPSSKIPFKHNIVTTQCRIQPPLNHILQHLQCLRSPLNQTPPICNYIITNNISPKFTPKILQQIMGFFNPFRFAKNI
uniref:Uncharacterized protein n=1 Tax=Opuntia streptacantha TaxID=393608 RepID=A0A7C9E0E6_OPUST